MYSLRGSTGEIETKILNEQSLKKSYHLDTSRHLMNETKTKTITYILFKAIDLNNPHSFSATLMNIKFV